MTGKNKPLARWISTWVVLGLLLATTIAHLCLNGLGNWETYGDQLRLTQRILWGIWIVTTLATVLTRVTLFGWFFRRYFRRSDDWIASQEKSGTLTAPWSKSGKTSFSFTVALVSVTGTLALTAVVLWILKDFVGERIFWILLQILGTVWWLLMIVLVLARIAVFGSEREKALLDRERKDASLAGPSATEKSK